MFSMDEQPLAGCALISTKHGRKIHDNKLFSTIQFFLIPYSWLRGGRLGSLLVTGAVPRSSRPARRLRRTLPRARARSEGLHDTRPSAGRRDLSAADELQNERLSSTRLSTGWEPAWHLCAFNAFQVRF